MNMLLRNTEKYIDIVEFSPSNGFIRRFELPSDKDTSTNGFFCEIEERLYGLGVSAGKIFVIVESQVFSSELLTTRCVRTDESSEFIVRKGESILCKVNYIPEKPFWNFFTMEDEDVDGLLLIHNILSSNERRQVFIENN